MLFAFFVVVFSSIILLTLATAMANLPLSRMGAELCAHHSRMRAHLRETNSLSGKLFDPNWERGSVSWQEGYNIFLRRHLGSEMFEQIRRVATGLRDIDKQLELAENLEYPKLMVVLEEIRADASQLVAQAARLDPTENSILKRKALVVYAFVTRNQPLLMWASSPESPYRRDYRRLQLEALMIGRGEPTFEDLRKIMLARHFDPMMTADLITKMAKPELASSESA